MLNILYFIGNSKGRINEIMNVDVDINTNRVDGLGG
jgi:hypothetical protein